MGREWKHHKYIRKEGKRYYYKTVDEIAGIESPDIEGFADSLDKIEPIKKVRDVLNTPIYSPNKDQETLISSAKEKLDKLIDKHKDTKLFVGGKDHLSHHGIRGQRWGVRRFQNKDGSLTPAGLKRVKQDFADRHSRQASTDGERYVANYKTKKTVERIKDEGGNEISRYQTLQLREKNNRMSTYIVDRKFNAIVSKSVETKGKTQIVDLDDKDIARGQNLINELKKKQSGQWDREIDKEFDKLTGGK